MKYCDSCLKRMKCGNVCESVERYISQDYVSKRETLVGHPLLDVLHEHALNINSRPVRVNHRKYLDIIRPRLKLLNVKQRKVLFMFFFRELSISEISRKLRITRPAASIRLKNALTILKGP